MKTYVKEVVILTNGQDYQMKFDARVHITNIEISNLITVSLKADDAQNWGIIEKDLQAGHMKGADTLLPKGKIKTAGGSCELIVWY